MSSLYRQQLNAYLKNQTLTGPNVLSIGCQEDDRKVFKALENVESFMTLDINQGFSPNIVWDMNRPLDDEAGDLELGSKYMEFFDTIIALNLWEYIYDPVTAHLNIVNMLKRGGKLITNYPFLYPVHKPEGSDMLRYTPEAVDYYLRKIGLSITGKEFIHGNELLLDYYSSDQLKARSGFDHTIIGTIIEAKKG